MALLGSFLIALGAALVAVTVMMTVSNYGELPDRIPVHFGFSPEPDQYGPKPMAWMMPVIQAAVLLLAGFAAYDTHVPPRELTGMFGVVDAVLVTLLCAQWLIIETAKNGPSWSRYRTFWFVFGLTMLVVPVSIAFGT